MGLGGNVLLTESRDGGGSTFTITIAPGDLTGVLMIDDTTRAGEPDLGSSAKQSFAPNKRGLGIKVLLVEDNADIRYLLSQFMEMSGAQVVQAKNGEEAVTMALSESFDVVLMDIQMPVSDGYEASRRLKNVGYDRPIIALTAHAMAGERERCAAAGCVDYLTKPIAANLLVDTIVKHRRAVVGTGKI